MKRKVIKHGPSTYIVSLPSKWVKEYGIKKGDELEVEEKNDSIVIQTHGERKQTQINLDISGFPKIAKRIVSAAYKTGADAIGISFKSAEEMLVVADTINNEFIGFEIIEEGKSNILAQQIMFADEEKFKDMLRRTFLFLLSIADDSLEAIQQQDLEALRNIPARDTNINKLTNFCRRYVNKRGAAAFKGRSCSLYNVIEGLEKIGDTYRDIAKLLEEGISSNKEVIKIISDLNNLLRSAYALFYNFKMKDFQLFVNARKTIEQDIYKAIGKAGEKDRKLLLCCYNLLYLIFDLNGPIMVTVI